MGLSVTTNVTALVAARSLSRSQDAMTRSLERLSSGYRINRAADDAAGLAISEGLRSQVNGMTQALRNTQDATSVLQTADGALAESDAILHRMRDLSVEAASDGSLNADAKADVQKEMDQLKAQLTQIASRTQFNGTPLLDGSYRGTFQVGANVGETITVAIGGLGRDMGTDGLGLATVDVTREIDVPTTVTPAVSDAGGGSPSAGEITFAGDYTTPGVYENTYRNLAGSLTYDGRTFALGTVDYTGAVTSTEYLSKLHDAATSFFGITSHTPFTGAATGLTFTGDAPATGSTAEDAVRLTPSYTAQSGASRAIGLIDRAVDGISSVRAYLGAVQNRLEHTVSRLGVAVENTNASMARIRDTDMAEEMSGFTRNQVLTQAGTAMLSQANQSSQSLLKLLAA